MKSNTPVISVIITAYNVAPFLREAVDSALAQTYRDIEIIVVDDGSTDGSAETLSDLDDPRLRLVRQEHSGSAAARNAGLRLASRHLVAFLDADDRWAPQNLERQVAFLESHPEVDLTFSHSLVIDEEGRALGKICSRSGTVSLRELFRSNVIGNGSCVVVRRGALDQAGWFNPTLLACVDIDAWMRVAALRSGNIVALPELLTFYRRRRGQISSDWRRMESGFLVLLENVRKLAPREVACEEKRSRAGRYRYYALLAREANDPATAARLLATAFRWAPLWLLADSRTWLNGLLILAQLILPRPVYRWTVRWKQRLSGPLFSG